MKLSDLFKSALADIGITSQESVTPAHEDQFNVSLRNVLNRLWNHPITRTQKSGWGRPGANLWAAGEVIPQYLRPEAILLPLLKIDLKKNALLWKDAPQADNAHAVETLLANLGKTVPPAPTAPKIIPLDIP